jgi:hypothetical protein
MKLNFAFSHHYLMKLSPTNGLITSLAIGLLLCTPFISQAEVIESDGGITIVASKLYPDPDPGDADCKTIAKSNTPVLRDSTSQPKLTKPVSVPAKVIEKNQKTEEDPLSFNFLYYIIEKFKMSDMIQ